MIGILQNHNLNEQKMSDIMTWHLAVVKDLLKQFRAKLLYNRTIEQLKKELGDIKLEDIIRASPSTLAKMVATLPHKKLNKYIVKSSRENLFCHLYKTYRKKYGAELIKRLEIVVCPYCNRNFINSEGDKTPAQFDHFFNKDKYSIFALSLYNLIPCCNTCNLWKGTTEFTISLYDNKYTTDELLNFNYYPKDINDYVIKIKAIDSKMQINIETLRLKERYAAHTDLLKELIFKRRYFCSSNRQFWDRFIMENGLPNNMSADELFYGNFLSEDKYYLRPLSKFTHDILEELDKLDCN